MRVTATQVGYYVKLRKVGEVFDIPDGLVSTKWMRPVEEPKAEEPAEVPAAVVETPAVEPIVKKRRGRKPRAVSE